MANCAKIGLTGRLTRDPSQREYNGSNIVSFSVAVNTTKKDGDKYLADFYDVSVFGKQGEYVLSRLAKGSLVQVYGDFVYQTYKNKAGEEKYSLSVRATEVIPLTHIKKEEENNAPDPF